MGKKQICIIICIVFDFFFVIVENVSLSIQCIDLRFKVEY